MRKRANERVSAKIKPVPLFLPFFNNVELPLYEYFFLLHRRIHGLDRSRDCRAPNIDDEEGKRARGAK